MKNKFFGYRSDNDNSVISNFNKKLEYFTIIEKHKDFYVLKTGREYFRSNLPANLKVFDIVAARIVNKSPLKLNLTDLSSFNNRKSVSDDIMKNLGVTEELSEEIIFARLNAKQIITANIINEIASELRGIIRKELSKLDLRLFLMNHSLDEFANQNTLNFYSNFGTQLSVLLKNAKFIFPSIDNSFNDESRAIIRKYLKNPTEYLSAKISGTEFDYTYKDKLNDSMKNYIKMMNSRIKHIVPLIFTIEQEPLPATVLVFVIQGQPTSLLTIIHQDHANISSFLVNETSNPYVIVKPDVMKKYGQFCTVAQNSLPLSYKFTMADDVIKYASGIFNFDMNMFIEIFSEKDNTEYIHEQTCEVIPAMHELSIPVNLIERYLEILKFVITS